MERTSIPVWKDTRDLVRLAKGDDQSYDEFLRELVKTNKG